MNCIDCTFLSYALTRRLAQWGTIPQMQEQMYQVASTGIELLRDKLPVVHESVSRYTYAEEFLLSLDCALLKHPPVSVHLSIVL
jgi:hypothetical protein